MGQTVKVIENLPREASFPLAFAALLLALGKSAVEGIADRLRLSGAEKGRIVWLVELQGALANAESQRLSQLKPILAAPRQPRIAGPGTGGSMARGSGLGLIEFSERMLRDTPPGELNPPPLVRAKISLR